MEPSREQLLEGGTFQGTAARKWSLSGTAVASWSLLGNNWWKLEPSKEQLVEAGAFQGTAAGTLSIPGKNKTGDWSISGNSGHRRWKLELHGKCLCVEP